MLTRVFYILLYTVVEERPDVQRVRGLSVSVFSSGNFLKPTTCHHRPFPA